MKYKLSIILIFLPSLLFANAYVCSFEYFPKIERKIKDKIGARQVAILPDTYCMSGNGAIFAKKFGDFDVYINCQQNISIRISRDETIFLNKTIERQHTSVPVNHSLISKNLAGLKLSCVAQEVGFAVKEN